jgi:hypothetical protein
MPTRSSGIPLQGRRSPVMTALAAALVSLCAALYAIYVASAVPAVTEWITNSDQLTLPAFVVDVFAMPANFFGWQLPRSSYLFPDTVAYALAYGATGDPLDSILLAHVPALLAWLYVLYRAAPRGRDGAPAGRLAWAIGAGLLFPLLLTQLSPEMAAWVTKYMFSFSNHFTCFVVGMVLLWWTLDELRAPSTARLLAIGVVAALMAASNRAIWLFGFLPIGFVLAATLLRAPRRMWRRVARLVPVVALAGVAGYAIEGSFNRIAVMPYQLSAGWIPDRVRAFADTVWTYGIAHPGMAAALLLLVAFYAAVGLRVARAAPAFWRGRLHADDERAWLFDAALLIAAVANVLAAMIAWQNIGNARYLMLLFFAPPLLARRLVGVLPSLRALVAASLVLFAGTAVAAYRSDGPLRLSAYARTQTAPLVSCLRELGVGRGLANYWIARRMAFLSNGAVRVDQVSPGAGSPETLFFYWGNNAFAFLRGHPDVDPYQYVIADTLDPKVLTDAFERPDRVARCAGREIWTYRDDTRLFAGLFQGHLDPWERQLASSWTVSIPAAAFRGAGGSTSGLARVTQRDGGAQIAVVSGSRLSLRAGSYRLSVAYSVPPGSVASNIKVGTLRLVRAGGQPGPFADLLADADGRLRDARVFLDVGGPEDVVEPQVWASGAAPLRVESMTITAVEGIENEIRLQAGDAHLHTQVGVERDGFIASTGKAGVLLFGPYLPLSTGRYRASLYFASDGPQAPIGRMDIVASQGRKVFAARPIGPGNISAAPPGYRVDLDFDLDQRVRDLELRVFVDAGASMRVARYEILPRGDALAARAVANPPSKSLP